MNERTRILCALIEIRERALEMRIIDIQIIPMDNTRMDIYVYIIAYIAWRSEFQFFLFNYVYFLYTCRTINKRSIALLPIVSQTNNRIIERVFFTIGVYVIAFFSFEKTLPRTTDNTDNGKRKRACTPVRK